MARKQTVSGGKKNEIIEAALQLFLENGYDGTSIRTIQKKVGSEIGLFYYYFKNKDDLFDHVLDHFFEQYKIDLAQIVDHGKRNPCRIMVDFFEYIERGTAAFREKYANNIHRSTRWAIRERSLENIEPYLADVIRIQSEYYGVKPPLSYEATAIYLTHGVGSTILHESPGIYKRQRKDIMHGVSILMGMPEEYQELRIPYWATANDMDSFMELVDGAADFFPNLDPAPFRQQLITHIATGEALVYRYNGMVVAGLLYSTERKELDLLAVHPDYRRKGLAGRLVETMAAQFPVGTKISVDTFRKGDKKGNAARKFYKSVGFYEGEEVTTFDYPCQRFYLTATDKAVGKRYL